MYDKLLNELEAVFQGRFKTDLPLPELDRVVSLLTSLKQVLLPSLRTRQGSAVGDAVGESEIQRLFTEFQELCECAITSQRGSLGIHLSSVPDAQTAAKHAAGQFLQQLPVLAAMLLQDLESAFNNDPAAKTREEILLCYPGFSAVTIYRIANALFRLQVPFLPRMMTEWAHYQTGIDIHPGATIGCSFFIDHGTGVVIGETCRIGSGVTLYQGVTLGAWSFPRDEDGHLIRGTRRHPTLEDNVTVYSNATILGGDTVIGAGSRIGSSVSLNRSVPPNTIVTIERPSLNFRDAA